MRKGLVLLCALLLLLAYSDSLYAWGGKKKKEKIENDQKKETPYEKLFKGKDHEVISGSFITIHRVAGKIYFEYPLKYMGRDLLIASTPSATSDPTIANVGYKMQDPEHVKFVLEDSSILLCIPNSFTTIDRENSEMVEASKINFMDTKFKKFKLETYNPDSTAVVFDMTAFFMVKNSKESPVSGIMGEFYLRGELKPELTSLGKIKVFEDNVSVETKEVYFCSLSFFIFSFPLGDVAINFNRSLVLLPEKKMKPRISDPRVGIFLTGKQNISSEEGARYYSYANRWDLQPKDKKAWERGELVEPLKPIVYYVDNTFPQAWKAPIKESVLIWNRAFEKIGFKNAIQVRDFPLDDPNFDPDNLKYSCLRYCPAGVANAMGPSWVDPTTGEIINASVIIYNDVIKLITQWRFIQTAQVDESVRAKMLPENKLRESIVYVVAHEVGHTLGLMHNMSASAAFPVDSLRSPSFTQKYGTTPSIMDYARFNYVAQPGDKGVKLTPPDLGVYDEYAIKWLYSPIAGEKNVQQEAEIVQKWIDEKAGDPLYRYGQQQLRGNNDPSALMEDLGDDPIKASDYGIKNLKFILPHINDWIKDDDFSETRLELYNEILQQYYRYITNVFHQVGGMYLTQVKENNPGERYAPVSKEVQKASIQWTIKQFQNSDWINDEKLGKNVYGVKHSTFLQNTIGKLLFAAGPKIMLCAHLSNDPYSIKEYYDDLYEGVWKSTIQGKKLTDGDKLLQRACISTSYAKIKETIDGKRFVMSVATDLSVEEMMQCGLDKTGIMRRYKDKFQEFELEHGKGIIANAVLLANILGPDPYHWQNTLNVTTIDESFAYHTAMMERVEKLLESSLMKANPADRAHYQSLLFQIRAQKK